MKYVTETKLYIKNNRDIIEYFDEVKKQYGYIMRKVYYIMRNNPKLKTNLLNTKLQNEYNISNRTANSIIKTVQGRKTANSNSISTNNIRIYKEKKENLVGTEISKIKYRSKYFAEDLFNIIKSDADLSSFISEKTYSDIVKNGTDLSQDKVVLSKEKEIENNQER